MRLTRFVIPIASFILALAAVTTLAILPFIPSWKSFQQISITLSLVGAATAGVFLCRSIYLQSKDKMQAAWRVIVTALGGTVLVTFLLVFGFFAYFLSVDEGIFGASFEREVYFADYDTTLYIYDNSFLDPSALVKRRLGWLPFTTEVGSFGNVLASDMQVTQSGEWVESEQFRLHLPTGKVERL